MTGNHSVIFTPLRADPSLQDSETHYTKDFCSKFAWKPKANLNQVESGCQESGKSPSETLYQETMHSYMPYEGPKAANQIDRKLGVFDRKLEGSHFIFY